MPSKKGKSGEGDVGLGGLFGGLGELVSKLAELAETGRELSETREIHGAGPAKELKGVYGFSVKVGLGGEGLKIEPFGNVARDKETGHSVVQEIREPIVDVFEEEDRVVVVAEMPGVAAEDVQLDVKDDLLTISAAKGDRKYRKEILLPRAIPRDKMTVSCINGMVEVRCAK